MRRMDRYRDNNDDLPKRYVKNQLLEKGVDFLSLYFC